MSLAEPHPLDVEIGALVRSARKSAKLSQGALARILGWHRPTLTIIESGKQSVLVRDIQALSVALGVPVARLLPVRWRR